MGTRDTDRGMTLTELMVVVVIISLLAAAATPMFARNRSQRTGQEFASQMARDFQRARFQAIADRLPVRAFVFADRVELRAAIAGASPGAPPIPATLGDPTSRVLAAKDRVNVWDVQTGAGAPASKVLSSATHRIIEWNSLGQARVVDLPGAGIFIYVRNEQNQSGALGRYRIEVAPLTGHVSLANRW